MGSCTTISKLYSRSRACGSLNFYTSQVFAEELLRRRLDRDGFVVRTIKVLPFERSEVDRVMARRPQIECLLCALPSPGAAQKIFCLQDV